MRLSELITDNGPGCQQLLVRWAPACIFKGRFPVASAICNCVWYTSPNQHTQMLFLFSTSMYVRLTTALTHWRACEQCDEQSLVTTYNWQDTFLLLFLYLFIDNIGKGIATWSIGMTLFTYRPQSKMTCVCNNLSLTLWKFLFGIGQP